MSTEGPVAAGQYEWLDGVTFEVRDIAKYNAYSVMHGSEVICWQSLDALTLMINNSEINFI